MSEKLCTRCKRELPLDLFSAREDYYTGEMIKDALCHSCRNRATKEYRDRKAREAENPRPSRKRERLDREDVEAWT